MQGMMPKEKKTGDEASNHYKHHCSCIMLLVCCTGIFILISSCSK